MISSPKITLLSMLTALAVILSVVESLYINVGIPGVRLGLANILILLILYELVLKEALEVNIFRILISNIFTGSIFGIGFLMSLVGAIFSFVAMMIFYLFLKKFSIIGVSVIGSLFHLFGQILVAMLYVESVFGVLNYFAIIGISGVVTGIIVGIVVQLIQKTKVIEKYKKKYKL